MTLTEATNSEYCMNGIEMRAHRHLLETSKTYSPILHDLILDNGPVNLKRRPTGSLFEFLSRTVVGQQLSATVASKIWARLEDQRKILGVTLYGLLTDDNADAIRGCGVSKNKVRALIGLREKCEHKSLTEKSLLHANYKETVTIITAHWGLGQWTADMCAIFFSGMTDVYPQGDSAIIKGTNIICEREITIEEFSVPFSPYRSYLSQHIWLGLDNGYLRSAPER